MSARIPTWLALAFFRLVRGWLVARCFVLGGDWRALSAALAQTQTLMLRQVALRDAQRTEGPK